MTIYKQEMSPFEGQIIITYRGRTFRKQFNNYNYRQCKPGKLYTNRGDASLMNIRVTSNGSS